MNIGHGSIILIKFQLNNNAKVMLSEIRYYLDKKTLKAFYRAQAISSILFFLKNFISLIQKNVMPRIQF